MTFDDEMLKHVVQQQASSRPEEVNWGDIWSGCFFVGHVARRIAFDYGAEIRLALLAATVFVRWLVWA
jgi:hypothetical protein